MSTGTPTGAPTAAPLPPIEQVKCEVCETLQSPWAECIVCGTALKVPPGMRRMPPVPIEPMPDLEVTSFASVAEVPPEPVPGLEPTVLDTVVDLQPEPIEGFEATTEPALEFEGGLEPVPDLERTVEEFDRTPGTLDEYPPACPHCGFEQKDGGRLCANCGLSRVRVLRAPPEPARRVRDEETRVRCRSCGAIVPGRLLCSDCGQPLPRAEE
jgi:hypothetical protein